MQYSFIWSLLNNIIWCCAVLYRTDKGQVLWNQWHTTSEWKVGKQHCRSNWGGDTPHVDRGAALKYRKSKREGGPAFARSVVTSTLSERDWTSWSIVKTSWKSGISYLSVVQEPIQLCGTVSVSLTREKTSPLPRQPEKGISARLGVHNQPIRARALFFFGTSTTVVSIFLLIAEASAGINSVVFPS